MGDGQAAPEMAQSERVVRVDKDAHVLVLGFVIGHAPSSPKSGERRRVWHRVFAEQKYEPVRWRAHPLPPNELFKILICHDFWKEALADRQISRGTKPSGLWLRGNSSRTPETVVGGLARGTKALFRPLPTSDF
jgi:hypothetical protein